MDFLNILKAGLVTVFLGILIAECGKHSNTNWIIWFGLGTMILGAIVFWHVYFGVFYIFSVEYLYKKETKCAADMAALVSILSIIK